MKSFWHSDAKAEAERIYSELEQTSTLWDKTFPSVRGRDGKDFLGAWERGTWFLGLEGGRIQGSGAWCELSIDLWRFRADTGTSLVALRWKLHLQCRRCRFDPGSERSLGGGHNNPLQYSCLENSMEPGRLQSTESQSQTLLNWLIMHTRTEADTMYAKETGYREGLGQSLRAPCGHCRQVRWGKKKASLCEALALKTHKVWLQGAFQARLPEAMCWSPTWITLKDGTPFPLQPSNPCCCC